MSRAIISCVCTLALGFAASALCAEAEQQSLLQQPQPTRVEAFVGFTRSDNIALEERGADSASIGEVGLAVSLHSQRRRMDTDLDMVLSYQDYLGDEFEDEIIGALNGSIVFSGAQDRLSWVIEDSLNQSRVNVADPLTPGNRELVNSFRTGPELRFGSQQTQLRLSGRYVDTQYEVSALDSHGYIADVALTRALSGSTSVLAAVNREVSDYSENAFEELTRDEGYLGYRRSDGRTLASLDLGAARIETQAYSTGTEPLARLALTRQMRRSLRLEVTAGNEYSSAGFAVRDVAFGVDGLPDASFSIPVADAFRRRYASLGFGFNRNRTDLLVRAEYSKELYETSVESNRNILRYSFALNRQVRPTVDLAVTGSYSLEDFVNGALDLDEFVGAASMSWRRAWSRITLEYSLRSRDSTLNSTGYTENRVSLLWTASLRGAN